jgi:hypothetical protein
MRKTNFLDFAWSEYNERALAVIYKRKGIIGAAVAGIIFRL